jgi:hypothetical protein
MRTKLFGVHEFGHAADFAVLFYACWGRIVLGFFVRLKLAVL